MHPDVTQRVAFGSRWIDNPYGGKTQIANVFRMIHDAELARLIADHLVDLQIKPPHPSIRTICTMLKNMPASKTRSLEVRMTIRFDGPFLGLCHLHFIFRTVIEFVNHKLDYFLAGLWPTKAD